MGFPLRDVMRQTRVFSSCVISTSTAVDVLNLGRFISTALSVELSPLFQRFPSPFLFWVFEFVFFIILNVIFATTSGTLSPSFHAWRSWYTAACLRCFQSNFAVWFLYNSYIMNMLSITVYTKCTKRVSLYQIAPKYHVKWAYKTFFCFLWKISQLKLWRFLVTISVLMLMETTTDGKGPAWVEGLSHLQLHLEILLF